MAKAIVNWDASKPAGTDQANTIDTTSGEDGNFGAVEVGMLAEHSAAQDLTVDWKHRRSLCSILLDDTYANIDALADVDGAIAYATDYTPKTLLYNDGAWKAVDCQMVSDTVSAATDITNSNAAFADMTNMSLTTTVNYASIALVLFTTTIYFAASSRIGEFKIVVGGADKLTVRLHPSSAGSRMPINMHWLGAVAAAAVTTKIQWRSTGATEIKQEGTSFERQLTAIYFHKA